VANLVGIVLLTSDFDGSTLAHKPERCMHKDQSAVHQCHTLQCLLENLPSVHSWRVLLLWRQGCQTAVFDASLRAWVRCLSPHG